MTTYDKGCIAGKNCLGILKYSFSLNMSITRKPLKPSKMY